MNTHVAPPAEEMAENAQGAATYLKTLAHEGRLMILCHLGGGKCSAGQGGHSYTSHQKLLHKFPP